MAISFFMDEHVPFAITDQLRLRGVDILTTQDDQNVGASDPDLLDRAMELSRIFVTQDTDLLVEASVRHQIGGSFVGIIYAPQTGVTIGQCVADLELIAKTGKPEEWMNRVEYLPLK